jgi:hypothetical protein
VVATNPEAMLSVMDSFPETRDSNVGIGIKVEKSILTVKPKSNKPESGRQY